MMRAALLVVMIAACGDSDVAPSPEPVVVRHDPPPCSVILRGAAERITLESKRLDVPTTVERSAAVMIASCEAEAWPAPVLACISSARLDVDLDACTEDLSYRQHQRLHAKLARLAPPSTSTVSTTPSTAPPITTARPRPSPRTATSRVDCSTSLRAPLDAACRLQYCRSHGFEPLCMVE